MKTHYLYKEQIDNIHTHQDNVFNTKLKHLMQAFKILLEPLNDLPPSRPNFDHKIEIPPNAQVPAGRVYKMSTLELQELKRQLQDYLSKKLDTSLTIYVCSSRSLRKKGEWTIENVH